MTATQIPVRLDVEALAPTVYKAVVHLDRAATRQLDDADLDQRLRELVRIRASQLNGCAYCVDMHTKDARAIGETEQRLYALEDVWRETPFTAASARRTSFTETVTWLAETHVPAAATARSPTSSPRGGRRPARADRHDQRLERAVVGQPRVGAGPSRLSGGVGVGRELDAVAPVLLGQVERAVRLAQERRSVDRLSG